MRILLIVACDAVAGAMRCDKSTKEYQELPRAINMSLLLHRLVPAGYHTEHVYTISYFLHRRSSVARSSAARSSLLWSTYNLYYTVSITPLLSVFRSSLCRPYIDHPPRHRRHLPICHLPAEVEQRVGDENSNVIFIFCILCILCDRLCINIVPNCANTCRAPGI